MESDVLDTWLVLSKNSRKSGIKTSHNGYYARFAHRRGLQRVIMGVRLVSQLSAIEKRP